MDKAENDVEFLIRATEIIIAGALNDLQAQTFLVVDSLEILKAAHHSTCVISQEYRAVKLKCSAPKKIIPFN